MKSKTTYSIALFLAYAMSVNAQIVYTDVNPDSTIQTLVSGFAYYDLDLNNDGVIDFDLRHFKFSGGTQVEIYCKGGNQNAEVLANNTGTSALQFTVAYDDTIGPTSRYGVWFNTNQGGINGALSANYSGIEDSYIGLRIKISGQWHYGWVRLNIPSGIPSFAVKDYAYNTLADEKILTGQMSTGIAETDLTVENIIHVHPNPFIQSTEINYTLNEKHAITLEVYNMLGEKISTLLNNEVQGAGEYKYIFSPKGPEYADNIYFIRMQVGNKVFVEKILKVSE